MFPRTKSRKGISAVLTTMIILVASVVLGTGVVLYGTSLFQTNAQSEGIATSGVKMWVDQTNPIAWGAAAIRNTGDKLVSVDNIQVRGTTIPYTNWYADTDTTRVTNANFQSQFIYTGIDAQGMLADSTANTGNCNAVTGTKITMDEDGAGANPTLCLLQKSGPVSLKPGEKMIVYFRVPDGILSPVDTGSTSTVNIFAGKTGAPTSVTVGNS